MKEHKLGPRCSTCGGNSSRAVRTRSVYVGGETIYYLTYVWSCLVCGEQWLDDSLERLNGWAADAARLATGGAEGPISQTDIGRLVP
jgi:YgiT-type zinc finger domain-containing protein